jgi:hypothetical protein
MVRGFASPHVNLNPAAPVDHFEAVAQVVEQRTFNAGRESPDIPEKRGIAESYRVFRPLVYAALNP